MRFIALFSDILRIQNRYNYELCLIRRSRDKRGELIAKLADNMLNEEYQALERRYIYYNGKAPPSANLIPPYAYTLIDGLIESEYVAITKKDMDEILSNSYLGEILRRNM